MTAAFTLIDERTPHALQAQVSAGRVRVSARDLEAATGWSLRAEGLCRGDVCVPVRERESLAPGEEIDLAAFAALLSRPLALDLDERVAVLGTAAGDRAASLHSLEAPDFALPDLEGRVHTLAEQRGRKVLLIAYASW